MAPERRRFRCAPPARSGRSVHAASRPNVAARTPCPERPTRKRRKRRACRLGFSRSQRSLAPAGRGAKPPPRYGLQSLFGDGRPTPASRRPLGPYPRPGERPAREPVLPARSSARRTTIRFPGGGTGGHRDGVVFGTEFDRHCARGALAVRRGELLREGGELLREGGELHRGRADAVLARGRVDRVASEDFMGSTVGIRPSRGGNDPGETVALVRAGCQLRSVTQMSLEESSPAFPVGCTRYEAGQKNGFPGGARGVHPH